MSQRLILVLSAGIVLAAWAICAVRFATVGGGAYNGGFFALFVLAAALFTIWSAMLVVRAWKGESSVLAAAPVSVLATASVLWLALAIGLRG